VVTPANVTATSSSIIIQIKARDSEPVLDYLGKPSGLSSAARVVFDVTALIDNTTVLDSFATPVTISYTYTDTDVSGLDETTLSMYHYHDDEWAKLDNCSVVIATNTITCNTPSFSTFAIFGSPLLSSVTNTSSKRSGNVHYGCKDPNATNYEYFAASRPDLCTYTATSTPVVIQHEQPARDLKINMRGEDVRSLQKFLNGNGFQLVSTGPGAPGSETDVFGPRTREALIKFQTANHITPSVGYFGPITRAKIRSLGMSGVWW
jgi:hypothetical protein